MTNTNGYSVTSVGFVRSGLKHRAEAPQQGSEGAPEAWVEVISTVAEGLQGIHAGQDVVLITWFHQARRNVLKLHPRNDQSLPLTGVFATRSPNRPNPLGLHRVRVLEMIDNKLRVIPLEAIDGTPVIDIKPVLSNVADS
jgi:tRNA-Thr(GGU) m(6)t(6)A37 methyltransferase TsaA